MNILIITLSLSEANGIGRYSVNVINGLSKHCDRIDVLAPKKNEVSNALNKKCNVYQILPSMGRLTNPLVLFYYALSIRKFIKKADMVHSFMDYPHAVLGALGAAIARKPFIMTAFGTYAIKPLNHPIHGKLLKFAYRSADRVLCISKFTENEILKRVTLNNLQVIPGGANYKKFQINKTKADMGKKVILSVGAIKPRKGQDVSIKALARVREIIPNVDYYIVGGIHSRRFYNELQDLARDLKVEDAIHFVGEISEDEKLIDMYYSCDVFVLTSRYIDDNFEGFGFVYLEANACGKPVIGTYDCGAEEAIIDGYNGLLVPQNEPGKTAEAIEYLLNNPEVAQKMGENGRRKAEELSWENLAKRIAVVYESVLNKTKGAPASGWKRVG